MSVRLLAMTLAFAAVLLTAGCGQKGPLFLPDQHKSAVPPPAPAPAAAPAAPTATPDKDSRDKSSDTSGS